MRAPAIRALGLLQAEERESAAAGWGSAGAMSGPPQLKEQYPVRTLPRPERAGDRFRRATRECLLALAAVDAMLEDAKAPREAIAGERTALLYVTAAAYGASNRQFIERRGGVMHFAYTAPAVVPAEVAIEFAVAGPYSILIGGAPATLRAIEQAARLLEAGACDRALVLAVEIFAECADLLARHPRLCRWPLVETAGCLWLEAGAGELSFESARNARPRGPAPRGGERFAGGPLAELREWRERGSPGPLELGGRWRQEQARLIWHPEESHARGSAA